MNPSADSTLDMARRLHRAGFAIISTNGKAPRYEEWQNLRLTEAELAQHFSAGTNIGLADADVVVSKAGSTSEKPGSVPAAASVNCATGTRA
jgi:hypothetical protein